MAEVMQGHVALVRKEFGGDELLLAADAGATVLYVGDIADFDEDGGLVTFNAGEDGSTTIAYTGVDDGDETGLPALLLAVGLAAPRAAGDRVFVWDEEPAGLVPEWVAQVTDDVDGLPIEATVAHNLVDKLGEQTAGLAGRSVLARREDGDTLWFVTEILGATPVVDASYLDPDTNEALQVATGAQSTADGKNSVYYGTSAPTGGTYKVNDLWFDSDDGYKVHRWNGADWLSVQDLAIAAAQLTADEAQSTADGKNTVTYSLNDPSAGYVGRAGDIWFKYAGSNVIGHWRWSGAAWVSQMFDAAATLKALSVAAAQIADAAIVTAKIDSLAVIESKIANAAVTTTKINDLAVTSAKIANLAVGTAQIADAAVTSLKVLDGAIVTAKIGDAAITTAKIGDAQIVNAKILDGTIQNAKIANLDAAKITTGFLAAARIDVNTITADKLLVGFGENRAINPGFEDGTAPHSYPNGTPAITTAHYAGTQAAEVTQTVARTTTFGGCFTANGGSFAHVNQPRVSRDETWFFSARVQAGAQWAAGAQVRMFAAVARADGTLTQSATGATGDWVCTPVQGDATWHEVKGSITVTAGDAYSVALHLQARQNAVGDVIRLDNLRMSRMAAGELIVDGSIIASHITAGAITGDKIAANAIDGKTITGALIRTAASGKRWEIGSGAVNEIRAYSGHASETAHGSFRVDLDAESGRPSVELYPPQFGTSAVPELRLTTSSSDTSYGALIAQTINLSQTDTRAGVHLRLAGDGLSLIQYGVVPGLPSAGAGGPGIKGIDFGTFIGASTNASGEFTVDHDLWVTPSYADVSIGSAGSIYRVASIARGTTSITVTMRHGDTNALAPSGTTVSGTFFVIA